MSDDPVSNESVHDIIKKFQNHNKNKGKLTRIFWN